MKTQIEKLYEEYEAAELAEIEKHRLQKEAELKNKLAFLVNEFEIAFKEHLPMLKEAGISYSAEELSSCHYVIKFSRAGRSLLMDFGSRFKYRFECVSPGKGFGNWVYDNWLGGIGGEEKFIKFIYDGLFQPVEKGIVYDEDILSNAPAPKKSKEYKISVFFTIFFVMAFVVTYRYFDKEAGAFFIGAAFVAFVASIVNYRLDR